MSRPRKDPKSRKVAKLANFIDTKLKTSKSGTLEQLSGYKFEEIWNHYDTDKNGQLEKTEIDAFLKDFLTSSLLGSVDSEISDSEMIELRETFLSEYDEDKDGRISFYELLNLIPVEDSAYLQFRMENEVGSSFDYMKVWKKYDTDMSGFIETNELKLFLFDVMKLSKPDIKMDDERFAEYANTIMLVYDMDKDGKLGLAELANLLPKEENFFKNLAERVEDIETLHPEDVKWLLDRYDKDRSGTLEKNEISQLARDILLLRQKKETLLYNASDVFTLSEALLKACDVDEDGRIDSKELAMIFKSIIKQKIADSKPS